MKVSDFMHYEQNKRALMEAQYQTPRTSEEWRAYHQRQARGMQNMYRSPVMSEEEQHKIDLMWRT